MKQPLVQAALPSLLAEHPEDGSSSREEGAVPSDDEPPPRGVPDASADSPRGTFPDGTPNQKLVARIDAFEDILDSEVGDTNLSRAKNLERQASLRQIYLKFEGGNPTGTQKDRIAFAQVMDALRRDFGGIAAAGCSDYGAALALAASMADVRCVLFFPEGAKIEREQEICEHGAEIVRVPGQIDAARAVAVERADRENLYEANPGGGNGSLQVEAYAQIAHEIYDELGDAPGAVAVPVVDGTTLAGIYRGFLNLYRRGKTTRMPRLIAACPSSRHPLIHAERKGLPRCGTIRPVSFGPVRTTWHAHDGDLALEAVRQTHGSVFDVTSRTAAALARELRDLDGFTVPAEACAGLAALLEHHGQEPFPPDRYVAVLSA